MRVCLYVLCGHLLGKGWPLGSRFWCLLWVCHFPIGILGQVWCLIVSIPDLCILTYFETAFCFNLMCFFMITITQKRKTKSIADVGRQRFTHSVFYTPPLAAKSSENYHFQLFCYWLVLINVEMLVLTKKNETNFVRFCWLSKCRTKNEFSECFHAHSWTMFCDVWVCYRLIAVVVKAMPTTSTHNILLESLLSDV